MMARVKSAAHSNSSPPGSRIPLLLVAAPSPIADRMNADLREAGFDVTLAETICHAEILAEAQYFDAAIYQEQLPLHEQISLARVMRVRWPWIRLLRCGHAALDMSEENLFDATASSESQMISCIRQLLRK